MTVPIGSGWRLQPITDADIPAVQHSVDDHVRRGLLMTRAFDVEAATRLVQRTAAALPADGRGAVWGIAQQGGDPRAPATVRGVITLRADEANRARVGFWLSAQARGRGVAAAAVRALARETMGAGSGEPTDAAALAGFIWQAPVGNVDSLRVARAAGFEPVGTRSVMAGPYDSAAPDSGAPDGASPDGGALDGASPGGATEKRAWWAELSHATINNTATTTNANTNTNTNTANHDRRWAECLVEIAAGAWQLQPIDSYTAAAAEQLLPVSACVPTGVWAAREITTARVDAVVALLHRGDRAWVLAQPADATQFAEEAATAAVGVIARYARRALGLITP